MICDCEDLPFGDSASFSEPFVFSGTLSNVFSFCKSTRDCPVVLFVQITCGLLLVANEGK